MVAYRNILGFVLVLQAIPFVAVKRDADVVTLVASHDDHLALFGVDRTARWGGAPSTVRGIPTGFEILLVQIRPNDESRLEEILAVELLDVWVRVGDFIGLMESGMPSSSVFARLADSAGVGG